MTTYRPRPLVVVAEDSASDQKMLAMMLELSGFDAVLRTNGRDALAAVVAHVPDVLVTDLEMPLLDGLQLCQAVRAHPSLSTLPVIVWSNADVDDPRLVEAVMLGRIDFHSKAAGLRTVVEALHQVVPRSWISSSGGVR